MTYEDLHLITACRQIVELGDSGLLTAAEETLLGSAQSVTTAKVGLTVPNLKAQGMTVASSVLLEGTRAEGQVSLLGAQMGGVLDCSHAA